MKQSSRNELCDLRAIIFMKVGCHGGETLDGIIQRKRAEERVAGVVFWGYGGSLCHPRRQVIPFVQEAEKRGLSPVLAMSFTASRFTGPERVATQFSEDGKSWNQMPYEVDVRSSRYAIVCRRLRKVDWEISLSAYKVAVGRNKDRLLSDYIRGRVDKACAYLDPQMLDSDSKAVVVSYVAELVEPYAVFVR